MAAEGREILSGPPVEAEIVDRQKELKAHEFRFRKRVNSPAQAAVLQILRADEGIWEKIEPIPGQQQKLETATAISGETQRVSSALFANAYRHPEAAVLLDVANYEATQSESVYIKDQIRKGNNYATAVIDGGGVYGTIASAAWLKVNPDNPLVGFEGSSRRGGIWTVSGDITLDRSWWRMNSRNRPEKRKRRKKGQPAFIAPGTDDNLNSLGADIQHLQVPDISSAQYPTNNELGRVLENDNLISNNLAVDNDLVKVRLNKDPNQRGRFQREYQDKATGERFFVYSDIGIQATGLGKEGLGFSPLFSSTREALQEVAKDLESGLATPRVVTFFQLVEATTSNRRGMEGEFKRFAILGKGDTSRVIREFFAGIGGIDPGEPAQTGFFESISVLGLENKTAEGLAATERPRYLLNLLDVERDRGGFFRVKPVEGRVVGIGIPKDGKEVIVYTERTIQTPEGPQKRIERVFVPRLVTAAGFEDQSDKIYSGLTSETIEDQTQVFQRLNDAFAKSGSTIYFKEDSDVATRLGLARVDIDMVSRRENMIEIVAIDKNGKTQRRVIDKNNPTEEDSLLLSASQIAKLEIAGEPPKFEPVIDPDYDSEIPIAEKAVGFDLYKIGACTSYPLTQKEKDQTSAYDAVPANTKSIFRFSEPVEYFVKKLAESVPAVEGSLNQVEYRPDIIQLKDGEVLGKTTETIPVDPKAIVQEFSPNIKLPNLLRLLAASKLTCVFPEGFDKLSFGIKRVERDGEPGAFNFKIQFGQAIPDTPEWKVVDKFLADPLVQRVLVRLTRQSTSAADISIGIKQGKVDIRNVVGSSVKNTELKNFEQKYNQLKTN